MNYITTCPACETQFLLNTEQLKAHRGKVQCGHCQHVFNAKNRLTEVVADTSRDDQTVYASGSDANDLSIENGAHNDLNVADDQASNMQEYNGKTDGESGGTDDFSTVPYTAFNVDENAAQSDYETYNEQVHGSSSANAPTFVQDLTTEPQFSKEPFKLKNLLLPFFGLLLLILAFAQTVYFLRVQIAAQYPQYKPYLQQACQAFHCEIKLAQNLDLLTIDDSDMQESDDYQDIIDFSSVLINNAKYVQSYPNIELTLTDTQDQPVLRKLVTPKEYMSEGVQIDAGIEALQEVRLNLVIDAGDLSVAGYRVLLVY